VRVVLKSKNDCAEKSEVTLNEMLKVTEPNPKHFGPLALVHLQPVIQVNRIFQGKIKLDGSPLAEGVHVYIKGRYTIAKVFNTIANFIDMQYNKKTEHHKNHSEYCYTLALLNVVIVLSHNKTP
jgi:hypothetical protein